MAINYIYQLHTITRQIISHDNHQDFYSWNGWRPIVHVNIAHLLYHSLIKNIVKTIIVKKELDLRLI